MLTPSQKQRLYQAFEHPKLNPFDIILNLFLLLALFINVAINVTEIFYEIHYNWMTRLEVLTVIIFTIELGIRFYVAGSQPRYQGLKGTLHFLTRKYTLIDVLALLPSIITFFNNNFLFLRLIRLLVFLRIFRLFKLKKILQKFVSFEAFATSSIATKVFILTVFSIAFIYLFQYAYSQDAINTSLAIFLDPPALAEAPNGFERIIGVIELMIGLFVSGTLISIITSLLLDITHKVHKGLIPYRGKDHLIIINNSPKLKYILDEIDLYYQKTASIKDIVLILPNVEDLERFRSNLPHYEHIDLICIYGETLNLNTYQRANLNKAQGLIMLIDEQQESNKKTTRFISKHFPLKTQMLVIETSDSDISDTIYQYILRHASRYHTVNHAKILAKVLNRATVDYRYFHLYTTLFSYDQYSLFIAPAKTTASFQALNLQCDSVVIIGYIHQGKSHINPKPNTLITPQDQIIYIAQSEQALTLKTKIRTPPPIKTPSLKTPNPIEEKRVCLVGTYNDIDPQSINEFLNNPIEHQPIDDRHKLFNKKFWQTIQAEDYDAILLNLEDNLEYELTLYIRALFKENLPFLVKIINIINDPVQAELLIDHELPNNFILSEKVVAQYLVTTLFHAELTTLFDELTALEGNEIYIIKTQEYQSILNLSFTEFKHALLTQGMLYIGCYINEAFQFNSQTYAQSQSLVVLFCGDTTCRTKDIKE